MNCCISCKHFKDAHYSRTYVSPRCSQRGDDDCAYMRQHICGIDGKLYEAKEKHMEENHVREYGVRG